MTEPDYPRNRLRATAGFLTSGQDIRARCTGFPMAIILHELLLFSCLAALVTGIVIAAASLL
jgi:hypothetical protein